MYRALALVVVVASCGDNSIPNVTTPDRIAAGTRIVTHPAVIGGLTDLDVVFYDTDAAGHTVAKAIPIDGGEETTIAASSGDGKADVRFEIRGNIVFVWTDRGNRAAKLTIWSRATGPIVIGDNVRPGRAAATADGSFVLYERDVATTTVSVVAGPIAGAHQVLATANSIDASCWSGTNLESVGGRLVARFCPDGNAAFVLRSYTADASSYVELSSDAVFAYYGSERIAWAGSSGALASAAPDGSTPAALASDVQELAVSHDGTHIAYLADGAIGVVPIEGGTATPIVASGARQLGALALDHRSVLYASIVDDRGAGFVQPFTDVQLATATGTRPLVAEASSCAGCLAAAFTADSQYAIEIDPIDNSQAADAAGPLHVFRVDTGASVALFGTDIYNAVEVGGRILAFGAVRDDALDGGWMYGLTLADLAGSRQDIVARGADYFAIDATHTRVGVSFPANDMDDLGGIWIRSLP